VRQQAVHQSSFEVAGAWVHHNAWRLVHNQEVIIFKEDLERHRLGHQVIVGLRRPQMNRNPVTHTDFITGFDGVAVDKHLTGANRALQGAAGHIAHPAAEENIEPLPGVSRINCEIAAAGHRHPDRQQVDLPP